jgi:hypothetical protein
METKLKVWMLRIWEGEEAPEDGAFRGLFTTLQSAEKFLDKRYPMRGPRHESKWKDVCGESYTWYGTGHIDEWQFTVDQHEVIDS